MSNLFFNVVHGFSDNIPLYGEHSQFSSTIFVVSTVTTVQAAKECMWHSKQILCSPLSAIIKRLTDASF